MCPRHFLQAIRISAAESKRLGCERPRRRPHSRWAVDGGVRDQPRRRRQMPGPISVAAIEHNGKPQMAWRNRRKTGRTMGRRPPRRLTLRVHVPAALSPGHLMPIMPAALPPGHLTLGGAAGTFSAKWPGRNRRGHIQRPPGHLTLNVPAALPPGHLALNVPAALPPGHLALNVPAALPPGHLALNVPAALPPGHLALNVSWRRCMRHKTCASGDSPRFTGPQWQRGLRGCRGGWLEASGVRLHPFEGLDFGLKGLDESLLLLRGLDERHHKEGLRQSVMIVLVHRLDDAVKIKPNFLGGSLHLLCDQPGFRHLRLRQSQAFTRGVRGSRCLSAFLGRRPLGLLRSGGFVHGARGGHRLFALLGRCLLRSSDGRGFLGLLRRCLLRSSDGRGFLGLLRRRLLRLSDGRGFLGLVGCGGFVKGRGADLGHVEFVGDGPEFR